MNSQRNAKGRIFLSLVLALLLCAAGCQGQGHGKGQQQGQGLFHLHVVFSFGGRFAPVVLLKLQRDYNNFSFQTQDVLI